MLSGKIVFIQRYNISIVEVLTMLSGKMITMEKYTKEPCYNCSLDNQGIQDSSASLAKVDHSIIGWNVPFWLFWVLRQRGLTEVIGFGRLVIGTILLPLCIAAWKLDDGKYWKNRRYHSQTETWWRKPLKVLGMSLDLVLLTTGSCWHLKQSYNKLNAFWIWSVSLWS